MSEERGKTMTNVNRIVAESNKVVRYINGNSIAEVYAKQEAHSAGVYISLTGIPEAICVARFNYGMKETSSVAITMQAAKLMAEIIFLFSAGGSSAVPEELSHKLLQEMAHEEPKNCIFVDDETNTLATRFMSSSKTRMPEKYIRAKLSKYGLQTSRITAFYIWFTAICLISLSLCHSPILERLCFSRKQKH